ncbi:DUF6461 domain-containing protein [Actinokineospora sp. G85]|uniref:DUF6461 domain-containing protein n=1 Tax=Actinokineospora sp. G85 TaxID=3406626 RepID=UPI003C73848D
MADAVAAAMTAVMAAIPDEPAAELGRARPVGPLLASRLLGALEPAVAALRVTAPEAVTDRLAPPPSGSFSMGSFSMGSSNREAATSRALSLLEATRPGAATLVTDLARGLAAEPAIGALLAVDPAVTGEEAIIAQHGRAHLALAATTASAVLRGLGAAPTAVVAAALETATVLLGETGPPPAYAAAALDRRRAEHRWPRRSTVQAQVVDHRYALAEGEVPDTPDFADNGLVAAVDGGVDVRTGAATGRARVCLVVRAEPPAEVDPAPWDEVVEISWQARTGPATVTGGPPDRCGPPWPGDYRARAHARGRDGDDDGEHHEVVVWPAPAADPVVHKGVDRLGHRLRGEPEPPPVAAAEAAYRWVERGPLSVAATITVVDGLSPEDVLVAFGADPTRPVSLKDTVNSGEWATTVAVRRCGDLVVAVEDNGFAGADPAVLGRLSRAGRAASAFWNVNAHRRLSFARAGEVLLSRELFTDVPVSDDPEVRAALAGLGFDDARHRTAKHLTAVARFVGGGPTEQDVATLLGDDTAYRTN